MRVEMLIDEASDSSLGYGYRGTDCGTSTDSGTDTESSGTSVSENTGEDSSGYRAIPDVLYGDTEYDGISQVLECGPDAQAGCITSEFDIDEVGELAEVLMSDDIDDPSWGLADPLPSASPS